MDAREQKGREIAERATIRKWGDAWIVPSQTGDGVYRVTLDAGEIRCLRRSGEAGIPDRWRRSGRRIARHRAGSAGFRQSGGFAGAFDIGQTSSSSHPPASIGCYPAACRAGHP